MKLLVADLMTEKTVFAKKTDSLESIYDAMSEYGMRHVPIVDSEKTVIGIVSHRDLVRACLHLRDQLPMAEMRDFMRNTRVETVMSYSVETIAPDDPIEEAGLTMLENKFSCLPVVEGQRLIGIITESDFVRHVIQTQKALSPSRLKRHLQSF